MGENMRKFGVPSVVCVNKFPTDTAAELQALIAGAESLGVKCVVSDHWANGGAGAENLAKEVLQLLEEPSEFKALYPDDAPIEEKIKIVATQLYRADSVHFTDEARTQLASIMR